MRAVRVLQFGGPEVMKVMEIQIPKPAGRQVLINVKAAGVNPVDTYVRAGAYSVTPPLPYTPGKDGAGIIKALGEEAKRFKLGDRVWFSLAATGTYAEYALCDESHVRALPENLSFEQGAAFGVPYLTAHRALYHKCNAKPGETVLIHGASGGVGIAAAQFALANGLKVFGTAGSDEGAFLLESLGVHKVFNHRREGYMDEIKEASDQKGVDIILEMLANVNLSNDLKAMALNGRIAIIGCRGPIEINPRDMMSFESKVVGVALLKSSPNEMEESFDAVEKATLAGQLNPVIGLTYPLEESHTAHKEIIETKAAKGKMILKIE